MPDAEFLVLYFTSPLPLAVIFTSVSSIAAGSYLFFSNSEKPQLRSRYLTVIFTISTFNWAFVGFSLVICTLMSDIYHYYPLTVTKIVFGSALWMGILSSILVSKILMKNASKVILSKLDVRNPSSDPKELFVLKIVKKMAQKMRIQKPDCAVTEQGSISLAVGGPTPKIVVSERLIKLLKEDELEAVLAHEMAHLKNEDANIKTVASVFKKFLFFDPIIRLTESAIHREREFLADRNAAFSTRKPAMLASALLKIHQLSKIHKTPSFASGLAIIGIEKGIFSRYPPLEKRIERLLRIAELLNTKDQSIESPFVSVRPTK